MLKATVNGDTDTIKSILHDIHNSEIPILQYNDENSLSCVLTLAYLAARDTYRIEREEKSAKTLLKTLLSSLCFSAFIEITQLIFSKGTFQFSDIVYNTLGGVLGAVIFIIINLIIKKKRS